MNHLICFGDSICRRGAIPPAGWCRRLETRLDQEAAERWRIHGAGVGGNTTAMALDRFMEDVHPWLPATVLIEFGINDAYIFLHARKPRVSLAEYVLNLREIVRLVQAGGGQPVLLVNHPMALTGGHGQGNGQTVEHNTAAYNQAVRDLSAELTLPCIDIPTRVQEAGIDRQDLLAGDGVHLSEGGEGIYADLVAQALVELGIVHLKAETSQ